MKKHSLSAAVLALVLALCFLCAGSSAEGARDAALDALFAGGDPVRLVPLDLNTPDGEPAAPVGLSPDGKILLFRDGIWFPEEGKAIPFTLAADKGIGDPYGKASKLEGYLIRLPGWEGFSWSSDGRYVALSNIEAGLLQTQSILDVSVLDTSTGEIWLADSFAKKLTEEGSGLVYLNRISRNGEYLYYLALVHSGEDLVYRFARCMPEGEEKTVLFETKRDDSCMFDFLSMSNLFETADGGWLLLGTDRLSRRNDYEIALIRFPADGEIRTPKVTSLHIPGRVFGLGLSSWSAKSGYGLVCLENKISQAGTGQTGILDPMFESPTDAQKLAGKITDHVNLLRILPGDDALHDVWYLTRPDPESDTVRLMPGEEFLWSIKVLSGTYSASEMAEAEKWIAENGENYLPAGYDQAAAEEEERNASLLYITCASISPDGYYALINAGRAGDYRLYLVSLETMEVRLVEAPEGIGSINLTHSAIGKKFCPGIVWNGDGTLIIEYGGEGQSGTGLFRLDY